MSACRLMDQSTSLSLQRQTEKPEIIFHFCGEFLETLPDLAGEDRVYALEVNIIIHSGKELWKNARHNYFLR